MRMEPNQSPTFLLASGSPRRRQLLSLTGWKAEVFPVEIDEEPGPGEEAESLVRRLALAKSRTLFDSLKPSGFVLAADTVVADGDILLGKPVDPEEAKRMLLALRGRTHNVLTAITLSHPDAREEIVEVCETSVPMRDYTEKEVSAYVSAGSPLDKAGAYGIQDGGFHPVAYDEFFGCYANVMGLPLCHLVRAMRMVSEEAPVDVPEACIAYTGYACTVYSEILKETM
jgi:MAF protein